VYVWVCVCECNERMSKKFMDVRKRQPRRHSQAANSRKAERGREREKNRAKEGERERKRESRLGDKGK